MKNPRGRLGPAAPAAVILVCAALAACSRPSQRTAAHTPEDATGASLRVRAEGRTALASASMEAGARIVDFASLSAGDVITAVARGSAVTVERSGDNSRVWDLAADTKTFVGFSNVIDSRVLIAFVEQGCAMKCRPRLKQYDARTNRLADFASVIVDDEDFDLDADNQPIPGTGSPGGFLIEDYPTLKVLQSGARVYVWMLSSAFTLKLVVFDGDGNRLHATTVMPSLLGRSGVYALDGPAWLADDGLTVALSNFRDSRSPDDDSEPAARPLVERYAASIGVPLSGEAPGAENIVLVHLDGNGVVRENRIVYGGAAKTTPSAIVQQADQLVLLANEWGDATTPVVMTIDREQVARQTFPLSDHKDTFDAAVLLAPDDLLIGASYDFQQARTGSVTEADDALLLRLRYLDGAWQEADRATFDATSRRDGIRTLRAVDGALHVLGYANGPLTHDAESHLQSTVWRL